MIRIKVCGLTREEDVLLAAELGAAMVGFIHVPHSPRFVDQSRLAHLLALVPAGVERVIVVQNHEDELLDHLRTTLTFEHFQFHGIESPKTVSRFGGYKTFHVNGGKIFGDPVHFGDFFLLDTQVGEQRGGTGRTFDWSLIPEVAGKFLVAGGLTAENVAQLVSRYRPWGLDVSSGVEASPGKKDPAKMNLFFENARRAWAL